MSLGREINAVCVLQVLCVFSIGPKYFLLLLFIIIIIIVIGYLIMTSQYDDDWRVYTRPIGVYLNKWNRNVISNVVDSEPPSSR